MILTTLFFGVEFLMNLGTIYTNLSNTLLRPDKDSIIKSKILAAVRSLHSLTTFPLDKEEWTIANGDITFSDTDYFIGKFTYPVDCRLPKLLWALDSNDTRVAQLELKTSKELAKLESINLSIDNTCYISGGSINFRANVAVSSVLLIGYQYRPSYNTIYDSSGIPRTFDSAEISGYTTWLLERHWTSVEDYVSSYVYTALGEPARAKALMDSFNELNRNELLLLGE